MTRIGIAIGLSVIAEDEDRTISRHQYMEVQMTVGFRLPVEADEEGGTLLAMIRAD